jgi:hypothetical protein
MAEQLYTGWLREHRGGFRKILAVSEPFPSGFPNLEDRWVFVEGQRPVEGHGIPWGYNNVLRIMLPEHEMRRYYNNPMVDLLYNE